MHLAPIIDPSSGESDGDINDSHFAMPPLFDTYYHIQYEIQFI